ncbi:hypothetical protein IGM_06479 [Bacillus cereus HuB4-4]|uniref:Uncharacterized protein n=1 Tax=Bacillus cereus HuB4-4 TaxID=1053211 RepID=A0A9W5VI68_BACCE|nr:type IV secretory system conjugative DNA transfer family protein [Bacillus cereus]EOP78872.1 hypothetical protein IGM_06479 [Bacillus cereus HuB4-4]
MTKLGKIEKAVEIVSAELYEEGNVNTAVVGATGTGKDFSVIIPNILLEEEKNLVVIDPLNQISNVYTFKKKQGYHILRYDLEKEGALQQLQTDLLNQPEGKVLIHAYFPNTFIGNKERYSQLVWEFLKIVKEKQDVEWRKEKSLHLFLMDYEWYSSEKFHNIIQTWCGYRISTTFSVQHLRVLDDTIRDNCHYILYKRITDLETAEWIAYKLKYHHVEFYSELLSTDLLYLPLTAGMLMDLPLGAGFLQKNKGKDRWLKIVETYNAEDILGRPLYTTV